MVKLDLWVDLSRVGVWLHCLAGSCALDVPWSFLVYRSLWHISCLALALLNYSNLHRMVMWELDS